ncbi:cytochrome P450 [Kutzneria sp. CA-103260]|uniref:cytochrome P450 n=1 Tax=Kutzneria sp. CA-103260 TaxID=2802641 RepID=UPI001BAD6F73|nr:cytochrome P450 [Kutzneria sp. CA-103260]
MPFDRPSPLDPPAAYTELRLDSPVVRTITASGQPAWVVIGADAAQRVLSDRRFGILRPGASADTESLLCDGDDHARLRRVISRGLSARALDGLRLRVEHLASEFVSDVKRGGPPADLVASLSRPLTLAVITEMLGVPVDDRERFYTWAEAVSVLIADPERHAATWDEIIEFLSGLVTAKRANPGDDLLSALVAVRDSDDDRLNDRELLLAAASLLSGGQLTTANSLSIGVIKLIQAGGLGGLGDHQAVASAVEEILRHQAGISGEAFPRWAHEDLQLAGHTIAAGDMVIVRIEAANRDPARFPDPDRFDPARVPKPHLRFGHGPHRCVGAAVARMEIAAAVAALANQMPGLAMTSTSEDIPWTDHPLDSGPATLLVAW